MTLILSFLKEKGIDYAIDNEICIILYKGVVIFTSAESKEVILYQIYLKMQII